MTKIVKSLGNHPNCLVFLFGCLFRQTAEFVNTYNCGSCNCLSLILLFFMRHQYWIFQTHLLQSTKYTAHVCRDLQGLCRGFLQYLQGKSCNIYRSFLQYLQIAEIAENPCCRRVPVSPCKQLQCTHHSKILKDRWGKIHSQFCF